MCASTYRQGRKKQGFCKKKIGAVHREMLTPKVKLTMFFT